MLNSLKFWLSSSLIALSVLACPYVNAQESETSSVTAGVSCTGHLYNPLTDTDWNNLFPITVLGARMGGNTNPPNMYEPPVCVCPGIFGIPSPGIGVTFWQPLYVSEIQRSPGCLSTLGGINVLPMFSTLQGEEVLNSSESGGETSRMQIHWYTYPVFAMLDLFKSLTCFSPDGFSLAYLTELDPLWQDDVWGTIFAPEGILFANPIAQAACSVDAAASDAGFPVDSLIWCAGGHGSIYPLTGNSPHSQTSFTKNNLVQEKFIARQARMGLQWQTIGPAAQCSAVPNPIWLKSQYRLNQIGPFARKGVPVVVGSHGFGQIPPISNAPTKESTDNLIWQGQQCCLRFY